LAVLLAHARHDLAGGVELAQLPADVTLDLVQLVQLLLGVERQRPALVVVARHRRQLAGPGGEERPFDVVVPLDGVEDADGPLRPDRAVAEGARGGWVAREGRWRPGGTGDGGVAHQRGPGAVAAARAGRRGLARLSGSGARSPGSCRALPYFL